MGRRIEEHHYADCDDPDCPRFPCRVYKEGDRNGYHRGKAEAQAGEYAAGYAAGARSAARAS
jgi:hypothetical protein